MKYTKLEKINYDGIDVKVGDLVLYQTLIEDADDANDYTTKVHYGIIQSLTKTKNYYEFDIKNVEDEEPSKEERFEKIIKVCTSEEFDKIIQDIKERTENKIKSIQSQIEQVKPDAEKQIKQYEELKALLK